MQAIIDGRLYDTKTAELLAHDQWFDGRNHHRNFRNNFLYRTKRGRFFVHTITQWQHEQDAIRPISREDARSLYEQLPVRVVAYKDIFGAPEEA